MNVTIHSTNAEHLLNYRIELLTPLQPFYHTAIQFTGAFGRILVTKIDLRHCTVWIINYRVDEPVTLRGLVDNIIYQVYFPFDDSLETSANLAAEKDSGSGSLLYLSVTDIHIMQLSEDRTGMLLVHYDRTYFNDNALGLKDDLIDIFSAPAKGSGHPTVPLLANAATISVIKQIMFASPANRIVHLYLEAKVKELLTLLYQLANPAVTSALSEKEIETLQRVKEVIMSDLSRSYNSYELSSLAGTNAYTLKTNFKNWFGIPLHHFLHNCRMEKATELLLHSKLSVKEISFRLGYKNVSNFSEAFKNYYGYPPTKLRELS